MQPSRTLKSVLATAFLAFAAPQAGAQESVTLRVHHFLPPSSNAHVKMIEPWCAKIAKDSAGKLKCQIYPAMQLGGTPPQLFDQAKDGVADIVWTLPGYQAGRFLATEVFELPFMVSSAEKASKALWDYAAKNAKEEYKGVKPLIFHVIPGTQLHTTSKQIKTLADFKGLKLRAPNRMATKLVSALGATPVPMPVPQVAESLSKGVIDGTVLPWEVIPSLKIQEIVKFHTETPVGQPFIATSAFVFAMNPARYDSLPADLKKVIDANSGAATSAWAGKIWDEATAPARQTAVDRKNTFYNVPAAEVANWHKPAESVIADWIKEVGAKNMDGQKLIAEATTLMN
ncbi:MAG: TRAP transporter substrate-binding protein [Betaproteobacteria bacterium]|nr:TRAP transporter substrate-binding protein [Betaproteobacteria bacterium]